jgi:FkbM family methyltransferase
MTSIKERIKGLLHLVYPRENGFNRVRILWGPARGVRMKLDLRDGGSYLIGEYDRWIFDRVKLDRLLKPGMVAWDCGAFYGYYASIFRRLVGSTGKVEVFEASNRNYEILSALPKLNDWENVRIHNLAVGPDHSMIQFTNNLGGSSGPYGLAKNYGESEDGIELVSVQSCGVDELILERGIAVPDIIKFDLETAEIYALHNGRILFTGHRPILLLELHGEAAMLSSGDFLSTYRYKAYTVWELGMSQRTLLSDRDDLKAIGSIPHMLLCFPEEHTSRINAIYGT